MSGRPLDKAEIISHLEALDTELVARGLRARLVTVGGSYLALLDLRRATADVDTVTRLTAELVAAISAVASVAGLDVSWLNDRAAAFAPPAVDLDEERCMTLFEGEHLVVLGPPATYVFTMKVEASLSRERDRDDLVELWPLTGFRSGAEAAAAHEEAYPDGPHDPFLADWLDGIAGEATRADNG